nr:hypothetical protein [Tanacetum cinerariifolium]
MKNEGKSFKGKLLDERASDYHSMGASKKKNLNFDAIDIDTFVMTLDNVIQKPSVVQKRVQPKPLHVVVGSMVEKDLATHDHIDIHGKANSDSCTMDPAFSICVHDTNTITCTNSRNMSNGQHHLDKELKELLHINNPFAISTDVTSLFTLAVFRGCRIAFTLNMPGGFKNVKNHPVTKPSTSNNQSIMQLQPNYDNSDVYYPPEMKSEEN